MSVIRVHVRIRIRRHALAPDQIRVKKVTSVPWRHQIGPGGQFHACCQDNVMVSVKWIWTANNQAWPGELLIQELVMTFKPLIVL